MKIDLDLLPWYQRLELLRTLKKWSQRSAAERCNVTHKMYWSWESGERVPHKNNRLAISSAFGVTEQDIFGNNPQKKAV